MPKFESIGITSLRRSDSPTSNMRSSLDGAACCRVVAAALARQLDAEALAAFEQAFDALDAARGPSDRGASLVMRAESAEPSLRQRLSAAFAKALD